MFGGDWPVCNIRSGIVEWVAALKSIVSDWSLAERRKLFHDNAANFYGVK
jgi:L-fuconolactonase